MDFCDRGWEKESRDVVSSDIVFSIKCVELEKVLETQWKIIGLDQMIFSDEDILRNRRHDNGIKKRMNETGNAIWEGGKSVIRHEANRWFHKKRKKKIIKKHWLLFDKKNNKINNLTLNKIEMRHVYLIKFKFSLWNVLIVMSHFANIFFMDKYKYIHTYTGCFKVSLRK